MSSSYTSSPYLFVRIALLSLCLSINSPQSPLPQPPTTSSLLPLSPCNLPPSRSIFLLPPSPSICVLPLSPSTGVLETTCFFPAVLSLALFWSYLLDCLGRDFLSLAASSESSRDRMLSMHESLWDMAPRKENTTNEVVYRGAAAIRGRKPLLRPTQSGTSEGRAHLRAPTADFLLQSCRTSLSRSE